MPSESTQVNSSVAVTTACKDNQKTMATDILNRNKEYIIRLIFSQMQAMTLKSALHMHLFDVLHGKWLSVADISKASPEHPPERFLPELCDTLSAMNLIAKRTDPSGIDLYSNRYAVDKYCRIQSEYPVHNLCRLNSDISTLLVDKIAPSVMSGTRQFNSYEITEKDKNFRELFHDTMTEICNTSKHLVKAFDLSEYKTFIDLGGGTGTYARFVREAHPNLAVTVLEMPKIVELALTLDENKAGEIKFLSGDFFSPLPSADVFSLCHVLHNWSDSECDVILTNIMDALNPGGAVIVMDSVLNEDRVGPLKANLTEVTQMSLHTGDHRTLDGYKTILRRNRFIRAQHRKASQFSFYECIIAYKP